MPSRRTVRGAGFSHDILLFLHMLSRHRVRYLVVGGEAVIFHGYPRVTGDGQTFERAPFTDPSPQQPPPTTQTQRRASE